MTSFKFVIGDFEITYQDGNLLIEQSETDEEDYSNYLGQIEIGMDQLLKIHAKAEELFPFYHPSCKEVSEARSALEKARDVRNVAEPDKAFEEALRAYMDITDRHKQAFGCLDFH